MPPDRNSFSALNIPAAAVPEWMGSFTLAAPPNTDLWRKAPQGDTSTAPILYTCLRNPFTAAEVTVHADWELEWDQGGLVIFAGAPPGRPVTSSSTPGTQTTSTAPPVPQSGERPPAYISATSASKWVKVGLEFSNNACHATSVCANGDGADWALTALPPRRARRGDLRVKIERIGYALWLWYDDEETGWKKLREVTSFFFGVEDKAVRVGVYASRPANIGATHYERRHGGPSISQRNLCVDFEDLEIF